MSKSRLHPTSRHLTSRHLTSRHFTSRNLTSRHLALAILGITIAAASMPTTAEAQRRSLRPTEAADERKTGTEPAAAPTEPSTRITRGKIAVLDLFRLIEDLSGKTVIPVLSKRSARPVAPGSNVPGEGLFDEHSMIEVVADLDGVTVPLVRALLAANWIALEERILENGRVVFFAFRDANAWSQVGSSPAEAKAREAHAKRAAADAIEAAPAAERSAKARPTPQLAIVDGSWTIEPTRDGTILVPIQHADLGEMRGAVRTLVGRKSLEILVLHDARHLILDGRGDTLLAAVELIRFLDRAELWPETRSGGGTTNDAGGSGTSPHRSGGDAGR